MVEIIITIKAILNFMSTFDDDHNHDGNPDRTDNYCLRDPHIIEDNGSRYLILNQIQVTKTTKAKTNLQMVKLWRR